MGTVGFCVYFILSALAPAVGSVAVRDIWPDVGGGILAKNLLWTPGLSKVGPSLPVPQIWNMIDIRSSFDLRMMNSSWSGPAKTNIYQKGESMYLQVSSSSAPDQELFIQSCCATPSSNPMDKSRSALILNKGCVSSKQFEIEFISRQRDSINLLLDTSNLKFSQIYIHCSVVFSSAVTPDTKSCNYNQNNSSWVELTGQSIVCECCASKCKGPPSYGGPSKELKALLSIGPLTIKGVQHEEEERSLSNSINATSQVGASTGTNQTGSGTFPSSMEKGRIVTSTTIFVNSKKKVPHSFPLISHFVPSDSIRFQSPDRGSPLSLLLPGLMVDVAPDPVLEMVVDLPQQKSAARMVGVSSQDGAQSQKAHSKTTPEETHQEAHDWKSVIPERLSEVYLADSPGLRNDWNLGGGAALEGFHSPEEELRGDVFMNYKWPQHVLHDDEVHVDTFVSPQKKEDEMTILKSNEKEVKKAKGDDFGKLEYVKKTLTFSQASDGSRSLRYEEEERSPSMSDQEVRKDKMEMDWRKVDKERSPKEVEKDLMQSLLDVVRGLMKTMYVQ